MSQIIDFKSQINKPITADQARLHSIYDVAVGLIIDISHGHTFSMAEIQEQMLEIVEIIREEA